MRRSVSLSQLWLISTATVKKEVLVATHDAKIKVLEPHTRRVDEGFSEARVLAEVSLLPDKVRIASSRRAVAMATGAIDRNYNLKEPRKQVILVVTSGWSVTCFDHNLKKLWDVNLQEDFPHNAHHREIAMSKSNYTLRLEDAGLIIVGGRMEMRPHLDMDPFEEIELAEKNAEQLRRSASEKEVDLANFVGAERKRISKGIHQMHHSQFHSTITSSMPML